LITDEMLRAAAARSNEMLVEYYELDYNPSEEHEFSPQFEKKMKRMTRRANHPILYRSMQRIASIFLVLFIGGVAWLSVDVKARAVFLGWVREIYETFIVYRFEGNSTSTLTEDYFPSWLPEGYTKFSTDDSGNSVTIAYINSEDQGLIFCYSKNQKDINWFVDANEQTVKQVYVNQLQADLYISKSSKIANSIVWISSDNTAFFISAYLDEADLIKVAEGVKKNK